jgi:hypothetical protein
MINHLPFFDDDKQFFTIYLPVSIKEYRDLYNNRKDKSTAQKELAFVAYICDYKSIGNIKGLSDKELYAQAIKDLELPKDYKPDPLVKAAMERYIAENNKGVFGYFKELMSVYESSRKAIIILNKTLADQLEAISNPNASEDKKSVSIQTILSNIESLKKITGTIERDVKTLNESLSSVKYQETKKIRARGDAYVSDSARV